MKLYKKSLVITAIVLVSSFCTMNVLGSENPKPRSEFMTRTQKIDQLAQNAQTLAKKRFTELLNAADSINPIRGDSRKQQDYTDRVISFYNTYIEPMRDPTKWASSKEIMQDPNVLSAADLENNATLAQNLVNFFEKKGKAAPAKKIETRAEVVSRILNNVKELARRSDADLKLVIRDFSDEPIHYRYIFAARQGSRALNEEKMTLLEFSRERDWYVLDIDERAQKLLGALERLDKSASAPSSAATAGPAAAQAATQPATMAQQAAVAAAAAAAPAGVADYPYGRPLQPLRPAGSQAADMLAALASGYGKIGKSQPARATGAAQPATGPAGARQVGSKKQPARPTVGIVSLKTEHENQLKELQNDLQNLKDTLADAQQQKAAGSFIKELQIQKTTIENEIATVNRTMRAIVESEKAQSALEKKRKDMNDDAGCILANIGALDPGQSLTDVQSSIDRFNENALYSKSDPTLHNALKEAINEAVVEHYKK